MEKKSSVERVDGIHYVGMYIIKFSAYFISFYIKCVVTEIFSITSFQDHLVAKIFYITFSCCSHSCFLLDSILALCSVVYSLLILTVNSRFISAANIHKWEISGSQSGRHQD